MADEQRPPSLDELEWTGETAKTTWEEYWCPQDQRWALCPGPCDDGTPHTPKRQMVGTAKVMRYKDGRPGRVLIDAGEKRRGPVSMRVRCLIAGHLLVAVAGLLVGLLQPIGWRWIAGIAAVAVAFAGGVYRERADWFAFSAEVDERIDAVWTAITGRWPTDER